MRRLWLASRSESHASSRRLRIRSPAASDLSDRAQFPVDDWFGGLESHLDPGLVHEPREVVLGIVQLAGRLVRLQLPPREHGLSRRRPAAFAAARLPLQALGASECAPEGLLCLAVEDDVGARLAALVARLVQHAEVVVTVLHRT